MNFLVVAWRLGKLRQSKLGKAAKQAVEDVHQYKNLQAVVRATELPLCKVVFCPRCGQLPTGDRRMEEAREIAIGIIGENELFKMNDLNFLLESYLWEGKHASGRH